MPRIAELQQMIANLAKVERVPHLADTGRPENDVEHSYGLALTCWFLAPKVAPELDLGKILQYALAHDTVELHAGDTYIFADKERLDSKPERERAAVRQLEKDWADFPELTDFAKGYMDKRDDEAKFVAVIDKLLPALMVNLGEKSKFWNRNQITKVMMAEHKLAHKGISKAADPYLDALIEWMSTPDYFYKEPAA